MRSARQVDFGGLGEWAGFVASRGLAACACGGAAWGSSPCSTAHTCTAGCCASLGLFVAIGAAMPVYAGAAYALRIGETTEALAMVRRRVLRRRA